MAKNETTVLDRNVAKTVIGASGTAIFGGYINQEEYNSSLRGQRGLKTYDQMRRSDPTIRGSLMAMKLPIMAAMASIEEASDDETDKRAAEFIRVNLFENVNWKAFLKESLTMLDFGHSIFEMEFKDMPFNGTNYIGLDCLGSRKQTSILKWEQQDGTPGITQQLTGGGIVSIPRGKMVWFTYDREGDNYAGFSALRSAYKPWYTKDHLEKIEAVGYDRQALGIPKLKVPAEANEQDAATARQLAENLRANEQAFIELPDGFELEWMDMKAGTTADPSKAILRKNREIWDNVLASFMDSGSQGTSGSYSANISMKQLFIQALESVAGDISSAVNKEVIPLLLALNGFSVQKNPKLTFGKISDDSYELAKVLQPLAVAGLITPDPDLEEHLRDGFHLPSLPDDIREDYANRQTPGAGPGTPQPTEAPAQDNGTENPSTASVIDRAENITASIDKEIEELFGVPK